METMSLGIWWYWIMSSLERVNRKIMNMWPILWICYKPEYICVCVCFFSSVHNFWKFELKLFSSAVTFHIEMLVFKFCLCFISICMLICMLQDISWWLKYIVSCHQCLTSRWSFWVLVSVWFYLDLEHAPAHSRLILSFSLPLPLPPCFSVF